VVLLGSKDGVLRQGKKKRGSGDDGEFR